MRLYHFCEDPQAILDHGFEEGPGFYHEGKLHRGVWLFEFPKRGARQYEADSKTIVVEIPDELAARHEWLAEGSDHRKFLIPADLLNRRLRGD